MAGLSLKAWMFLPMVGCTHFRLIINARMMYSQHAACLRVCESAGSMQLISLLRFKKETKIVTRLKRPLPHLAQILVCFLILLSQISARMVCWSLEEFRKYGIALRHR